METSPPLEPTPLSDPVDDQIHDSVFDRSPDDSEYPSGVDTNTTPGSELYSPESPSTKPSELIPPQDGREKSRALAATLSLEEQVKSTFNLGKARHTDCGKGITLGS